MQSAAWHQRLEHFLHHQRQEKRHRDFIDEEIDSVCEPEVALGCGVRPNHGGRCAERQQEEAVDSKAHRSCESRSARRLDQQRMMCKRMRFHGDLRSGDGTATDDP